jgi:hypothetical protein
VEGSYSRDIRGPSGAASPWISLNEVGNCPVRNTVASEIAFRLDYLLRFGLHLIKSMHLVTTRDVLGDAPWQATRLRVQNTPQRDKRGDRQRVPRAMAGGG